MAGAQPALAATEVGNGCEAPGASNFNRIDISLGNGEGSALPAVVPQSGVITGWRTRVSELAGTTVRMKVAAPTGVANRFRITAESGAETLVDGLNSFPARIPVQAGDHLALAGHRPDGQLATPTCFEAGGSTAFVDGQDPAAGTEAAAERSTGVQVPLIAIVEPDADRDGFGDETQDRCAQSASTQGECPTSLSMRARAGGRSAVVFVSTSARASVGVNGAVKLGRGRPVRLRGGTQTVAGGDTARFVLRFPAKLRARLSRLRPKHWLRLHVSASATTAAGQVTTGITSVKLTGRAES